MRQLVPLRAACNQSCSSVGGGPLQQCAPGDADDDHDACDEFSSCGQLDQSTGRERKEEEREKTEI